MKETDKQGEWEVTKGANCKIRQLVQPSQSFLDWQASNPIIEPEPVRDAFLEINDLRVRVEKLEKRSV